MPQHGVPNWRRDDRQNEPALKTLWPNYLQGGYFDQKDHLREEYVSRSQVERLVIEMGKAGLVMHQMRRFFQHARGIEAKLKAGVASWEAARSIFKKLDVAAADAYGKIPRKIPKLFHDFISFNVASVVTEKDFLQGFLPHFEALVGFGAQHLKERERN